MFKYSALLILSTSISVDVSEDVNTTASFYTIDVSGFDSDTTLKVLRPGSKGNIGNPKRN